MRGERFGAPLTSFEEREVRTRFSHVIVSSACGYGGMRAVVAQQEGRLLCRARSAAPGRQEHICYGSPSGSAVGDVDDPLDARKVCCRDGFKGTLITVLSGRAAATGFAATTSAASTSVRIRWSVSCA